MGTEESDFFVVLSFRLFPMTALLSAFVDRVSVVEKNNNFLVPCFSLFQYKSLYCWLK